jgi:uncharacterized protein
MTKTITLFVFLILVARLYSIDAGDFNLFSRADTVYIIEGDTLYSFLFAASQGDSATVLGLLKNGVKADTTSWEGITAMTYAIQNGHTGTVKVLTENGATINRKDKGGYTPLLTAVQGGNLEIAEYLIRNSADINLGDRNGITPLMLAVAIDSFALADMLLYYGADATRADRNGTTALMVAAVTGNHDIALALLEAGADPNAADKKGFVPLHAAIWYGYWSEIELLLDYGADANVEADDGYVPLGIAIEANDFYATKLLASAGADINHRISFSQNPLTVAVEKRDDSIASFLRRNHARYNPWPCFNKFGLGTEIDWNTEDYRWSFSLAANEKKYNLNIALGFGFRPSDIRVLETRGDFQAYQYYEKRRYLFLSLEKSVFLLHGGNHFQAGIYGGIKGIYTYGSYRGSNARPDDRFLAAPGLGFAMEGRSVRFSLGYEYYNLDLYKISPHHINLSFYALLNRNKNNFKPDFIYW